MNTDVKAVIAEISYKPNWAIICQNSYLQVEVIGVCSIDGSPQKWRGAKHRISSHMCKQELVGLAFTAIKQAEEHEMREFFRYKGASIFNPHLDPDVLAEVAKKRASFVMRDNAMSMEESDDET